MFPELWETFGIENLCDWLRLALAIIALDSFFWWRGTMYHRGTTALFAAWCWYRALFSLRGWVTFGPGILAILRALQDTVPFVMVTVCCLFAFTHAYYLIETREVRGGVHEIYATFLPVFRLAMLGDFDLFELEGQDTVFVEDDDGNLEPDDPPFGGRCLLAHCLFFGTSIMMTVMMLTLLTGILSNNYDRFMEYSRAHFLREQAAIITSRVKDPMVFRFLKRALTRDKETYLWAALREVEELDPPELKDLEELIMNLNAKGLTDRESPPQDQQIQQQMMHQFEAMQRQMTQLQASNEQLINWFTRLKEKKRDREPHIGANAALRSAGDAGQSPPDGFGLGSTAVCDTVPRDNGCQQNALELS